MTTMSDDELEDLVARMAGRVRRLEDAERIRALHRIYIRGLADRCWVDMLGCFTTDAVVDLRHHGVRRGHAEIAELFGAMHAAGNPHDGYLLTSPVIDVQGEHATGLWTWHRQLCEFPVMGAVLRVYGPWWEGRYRCTYRRTDVGWKFSTMHFRLVQPDADRAEVVLDDARS